MFLRLRLFFFLFLFSFFGFAQPVLLVSLVENNGLWHWSVSIPGEGRLRLVLADSVGWGSWQFNSAINLRPLQSYAMPRFTESYEVLDCYEHHLIQRNNPSDTSGDRHADIGARPRTMPPSRGGAMMTDVEVKNENGQYQITWEAMEQGVYQCIGPKGVFPGFRVLVDNELLSPVLHLFSISEDRPLTVEDSRTLEPRIILPHEIDSSRLQFLNTWFGAMGRDTVPTLLYSWDIGDLAGDKCDPCPSEPPSSDLLKALGANATGAHRYYTYCIVPADYSPEVESASLEKTQVLLDFFHVSVGLGECLETKEASLKLFEKRQREEENLKILLGSEAAYFLRSSK